MKDNILKFSDFDKIATLSIIATMANITFSAKEAKNNFGRLLEDAVKFPVTINKNGRNVAVIMSIEEYEKLETLSDQYWLESANIANKEGYVGIKKSKKLIGDILNQDEGC